MTGPAEPPPPARRSLAISFDTPDYCTPEQTLAVVELRDELRERIWAHYDVQLIDLIQTEHRQPGGSCHD